VETRNTANWADQLMADRAALDRGSTAERVADVLRSRITEGLFPPGKRLSEEELVAALGVSRNTLRESFRLLVHEGLLVHELNRGVFVRTLSADDVVELYQMRRLIECAAIRGAGEIPDAVLKQIGAAVDEAEEAAAAGKWFEVGTANMRFHQAIVSLAGSRRMSETARQVLAELRLVFHVMSSHREFHEPYLHRNRRIYHLLAAGDAESAAKALEDYLDAAERQLVEAYRARNDAGSVAKPGTRRR
jgi:DNA-binding GntR family transcriptional regulator